MQLDSVQIGVVDLDEASRAYALLLGVEPVQLALGSHRFQLARGAIELEVGEPGVQSVGFVHTIGDSGQCGTECNVFNGLAVRVRSPVDLQPPTPTPDSSTEAIDHVVVQSPNLDRAIALWRDRLGTRLALDQEFPTRGLRICFFRSAGITLEFVSSLPAPPDLNEPDRFYGIAYRVVDLEASRTRLLDVGINVTAARPGQKPGTTVATVRSGTCGVPTLLIEEGAKVGA